MVFSVEFDRMLYFQGFDGILGWIVVIFDGVKSGEMLDFVGFYRSGYRSGCLCEMSRKCRFYKEFVDRTDMLLLAIEHLL